MITYDAYKDAGGTLDEAGFAAHAVSAEAVLTELTAYAPQPWTAEQQAAYDRAFAAVVDRAADPEASVVSEHVGNTTVTYAAGTGGRGVSDSDVARGLLAGTGLLYRGV